MALIKYQFEILDGLSDTGLTCEHKIEEIQERCEDYFIDYVEEYEEWGDHPHEYESALRY